MAEFHFRTLAPGQEVEFTISAAEPTYEFSGRAQHFVALGIPDDFAASAIQVRSFLTTPYLPSTSAVMPEFIYLGSDFRVVGGSPASGFQSAGTFWRSAVSGRARVPSGTRYVVVIAGDGRGGLPVLYSENRTPYTVRPAALGDFSLRLFGEPLKP